MTPLRIRYGTYGDLSCIQLLCSFLVESFHSKALDDGVTNVGIDELSFLRPHVKRFTIIALICGEGFRLIAVISFSLNKENSLLANPVGGPIKTAIGV